MTESPALTKAERKAQAQRSEEAALNRRAEELEMADWKQRISSEASQAMAAAAALPPHEAAPAWLAADRIVAKVGARFPSIASPSEFACVLFVQIPFPRELCLLVSSYTVDPSDATADGLEHAVVARAYCLTAGNGPEGEAFRLRVAAFRLRKEHLVTMEDLMLRLFHIQNYKAAEQVADEFLNRVVIWVGSTWMRSPLQIRTQASASIVLSLCAAFRHDRVTSLDRLAKVNHPNALPKHTRLWHCLALAWSFALFHYDLAKAKFHVSQIITRARGIDQFQRSFRRLIPHANALFAYICKPTGDILSVHDAAVAALRDEDTFPCTYPRKLFDAPKEKKSKSKSKLKPKPKPKAFPLLF
jgi:hypothetical protein